MMAGKILVVDEEIFIRRTLRHMLKKRGYQVSAVANGQEAWDCICSGYGPDIMIMGEVSLELPWFDLCRSIKAHPIYDDIFIVWLTDRWHQTDKEEATSAGVDEYMTKPFSPSAIAKRVKEILEDKNDINHRQLKERRQPNPRLADASESR